MHGHESKETLTAQGVSIGVATTYGVIAVVGRDRDFTTPNVDYRGRLAN